MIRVALAEDHAEMRMVLKLFLGLAADMELICEAENGAEALECVQSSRPNVLVMDINMPVMDGLQTTQQITEMGIDTQVLLISFQRGSSVNRRALEVGAKGYLPKEELAKLLLDAIRTVHAGGTFFIDQATNA